MADVLNLDCFTGPDSLRYKLEAQGFDPRIEAGPRNGGLLKMNRVHMEVGQFYYRFCDTARFTTDEARAIAGAWWIEYETFNIIREFARRHQHIRDFGASGDRKGGLAYSAKLHLAVPYEWGDCGAVVCASLHARLDAYKGWGDTARLTGADPRDGGAKYIPLQNKQVFQLYVPEMRRYFSEAVTVVEAGLASKFA